MNCKDLEKMNREIEREEEEEWKVKQQQLALSMDFGFLVGCVCSWVTTNKGTKKTMIIPVKLVPVLPLRQIPV